DKRNCQTKCAKEIDHDDDEHICQSNRHNCGAPCSLQANTKKGFYKCPNKCIIPCEDEHERHCCENDSACPIQCPIPDCQRRCQKDCQELGICKVLTEPRKQEEVYQGLVQGTSITFTKYIQLSERIKCCKKIPPNAFHHDGKHTHDESGFHYCDAQYPYSVQEQEMFEKCDHECADEIHQPTKGSNIIPNRSFCELPLFHAPLKLSDAPPNGIGYISLGGHHFTCDNPAKKEGSFHIIFTIDRSGSMSSTDKKPLPDTPVYNLIKARHENRTGAVYSAVYSFMEARLAAQARSQLQSTNKDTVSLILFSHEVIVPFENHVLTDSKTMLNQMLPHGASANVIIFLSDGGCSTPKSQLEQICKYNSDKGPSLREMAEIAGRYNPANKIGNALRCHFTSAMNEINLINTFTGVAE
ncbi:9684_t:CDS:2, partial [Racocetra fulgida]